MNRYQILGHFNRSINYFYHCFILNQLDFLFLRLLDPDFSLFDFSKENLRILDLVYVFSFYERMDPSQNRLIYHKFCSRFSTNHLAM